MGSLIDKRAFVTGAEQGIGKAIAEQLLQQGCDVFMHCYSGQQGLAEVVALARTLGRRTDYFQADLTSEAEAATCVQTAVKFLGGLEILVVLNGFAVEDLWE